MYITENLICKGLNMCHSVLSLPERWGKIKFSHLGKIIFKISDGMRRADGLGSIMMYNVCVGEGGLLSGISSMVTNDKKGN